MIHHLLPTLSSKTPAPAACTLLASPIHFLCVCQPRPLHPPQVKFDPEHHDDDETAKPWEVGVHDGFGDLYIRKAQQPIGNTGELGQPESPHQVG